jgi:hypothetical protein
MKLPRLVAIAAVLSLMAASFLFGRMSAEDERAADGFAVAAEIRHAAPVSPDASRGARVELVSSEPERLATESVVAAPEPAPAPVPDAHPEENDEQRGFRLRYAGLGVHALEREQRGLHAQLAELATPEYDACLRRGEYEVVGKGTSYRAENWDNERMAAIRMEGGDEARILKITLDERSHPDLYAKWREILWMNVRLKELAELSPSDASRAK